MSICPGLVGDTISAATFRAFLGAPPTLAVEKRLLKHMHATVGPWFVSRRRVREGANEYLEFDGSTMDTEIMMRHCHIFFLRRQLFSDILEKQISVLEAGKAPREADPTMLACLSDITEAAMPRLQHERRLLEHTKTQCTVPHRRELRPEDPLDKWDTLCMMRCLEADETGFAEAESMAKAFLPLSTVSDSAQKLAQLLLRAGAAVDGGAGSSSSSSSSLLPADVVFDKKDEKFLNKAFVPGDYSKIGCAIPRLRPTDVTAYFRFFGERVLTNNTGMTATTTPEQQQEAQQQKKDPVFYFRRSLWGHVFRRFATNPAFLSDSVSQYWASNFRDGGDAPLHANPPSHKMPMEIAAAVCRQQALCPATRLRTQYMYTHHDNAKQLWRTELVMPSLRMLSTVGVQCSEDMLGGILVDGFFDGELLSSSSSSSSANQQKGDAVLVSDDKMRQIVAFVNEMSAARSASLDAVLQKATHAAKNVVVPPLTEDEANWSPPVSEEGLSSQQSSASASVTTDDHNDDDDDDGIFMFEEGVPELDEIPNEHLK